MLTFSIIHDPRSHYDRHLKFHLTGLSLPKLKNQILKSVECFYADIFNSSCFKCSFESGHTAKVLAENYLSQQHFTFLATAQDVILKILFQRKAYLVESSSGPGFTLTTTDIGRIPFKKDGHNVGLFSCLIKCNLL